MGRGPALEGRAGHARVRSVQSGVIRGQREQTQTQDLAEHPASASELRLLTWKVEPRTGTMSQAAERPDGRLSISRPHHALPSPWHTPSFHCKDTWFLHEAMFSVRAGPRLGHSCPMLCAWDC